MTKIKTSITSNARVGRLVSRFSNLKRMKQILPTFGYTWKDGIDKLGKNLVGRQKKSQNLTPNWYKHLKKAIVWRSSVNFIMINEAITILI